MQKLNFGSYVFRFKSVNDKISVFDPIRKKFVVLTPEEWVRQHVVQFLLLEKNYPKSLINVEKLLQINKIVKRYDVVVFNSDGSIRVLVECKSPQVKISQHTFDQIARYNLAIKADVLMVTNGLQHYYCTMDYVNEKYFFLNDLPTFEMRKPSELK